VAVTDDRRARFDADAVVHLRAVYNAAYRLTRHPDRARDLTQDTMLRAFRAFDTFTAGTNARAWLLKITYSVFINQYHHDRRRPQTQSIDELEVQHGFEPAAPAVPTPDPWQPSGWSEPAVTAALEALPDDFRTAVLLVDVEELSYEEAAAAMDCAVGTVRSRLFRARRLLAATLKEFGRTQGHVTTKAESR
jgi:RNA polymerase sigma-70 factor, ECF subfamily